MQLPVTEIASIADVLATKAIAIDIVRYFFDTTNKRKQNTVIKTWQNL